MAQAAQQSQCCRHGAVEKGDTNGHDNVLGGLSTVFGIKVILFEFIVLIY